MLMLLALMADAGSAEADQRLARMTSLYQEACLKAFPDDRKVEAMMTARKARELTREEVKVTMNEDPARGWELADGGATVWIEFPPFHACSVRWNTRRIGDLRAYRAIAREYESISGAFRTMRPYDVDLAEIHVHAVGERRELPDKSAESLYIIDQHINDPKLRKAGETGVVLRFVHQYAPRPSGAAR